MKTLNIISNSISLINCINGNGFGTFSLRRSEIGLNDDLQGV